MTLKGARASAKGPRQRADSPLNSHRSTTADLKDVGGSHTGSAAKCKKHVRARTATL